VNSASNIPRRGAARVVCTAVLTVALVSVLGGVAAAAIIVGTNGPDLLLGTSQADMITARDGNDLIFGLTNDDRLLGGNGNDFINGDGRATCPPGTTDPAYCALSNNETVGGDDYISAGNGDDIVEGGVGDDTIYAGFGRDRIEGEAGDDIIFAKDGEVDTIDCGTGIDLVTADARDIVSANCERRINSLRRG
jgi:Ca2+-binding RTX toxin-like protein